MDQSQKLIFAKKRDLDLSLDFLKFILPELLVTHFDLATHQLLEKDLHLFFEEKSAIPNEFSKGQIISHGFHKEITIEDFPLRGKRYYFILSEEGGLIKRLRKLFKEIGI